MTTALTVSRLARRCGISRTAILYYESAGLLKPSARTDANYRHYGERDVERLQQICAYRQMGLSLADIRSLIDARSGDAAAVLKRRLIEIGTAIETLRGHQRAILKLLSHKGLSRNQMMTKDKWIQIMKASGFTQEQMHAWHSEFERSAPEDHQEFLEYLRIPGEEIAKIRRQSRGDRQG